MRWTLSDPRVKGIVYQVVMIGLVAWLVGWLASNTMHNLEVRRIASGFGFLSREAGLPIGCQIVGPMHADRRTIAVAGMLEELLGGFRAPKGWA